MAKKLKLGKKLGASIGMTLGYIVMLAIGGFFVDGGFLNVFILKLLPLIVHQIVGWSIIGLTLLSALLVLLKK